MHFPSYFEDRLRPVSAPTSLARRRVDQARETIERQAMAVAGLASQVDRSFSDVVELILGSRGRVVFCGMGKSGLIARKLSATFSSTGTPSLYLHPADALHGDLGSVTADDVVVMLSYSGETSEITALLPALRGMGVSMVALVGRVDSTLANAADVVLRAKVDAEVCPNGLAPTTSSLAALALGDALAVALMHEREFSARDFAQRHPGGSLGRSLHARVRDEMRTEDLPVVGPTATVADTIITMTEGRLGLALVVRGRRVVGIVTDGDLRRAMLNHGDLSQVPVTDIMSAEPRAVSADGNAVEAEERMRREKVKALVVVDRAGMLAGVLDIFR